MHNGSPIKCTPLHERNMAPRIPRWQETYAYSNGSGGVAMVKVQAHPGKAFKMNPDGTKVEVDADPRWVGNGRAVLNNKGKPAQAVADPFFSTTHELRERRKGDA